MKECTYRKINAYVEEIGLMSKRNNCIVVDGVVGVGKSTLMRILAEELGLEQFMEPVVDNPVLDKFYYNKERYSFPLQVFFLNHRFKMIKEASEKENTIMDRSIYGDVIFAKMLCDRGEMTVEEYNIYMDLFMNMLEHVDAPKLMIYLKSSVNDAVRKIKKRGRDFEQDTEIAYWEKLNKEYDKYFENYNMSKLLTIETDGIDFENNAEDRKYVLDKIKNALKELK